MLINEIHPNRLDTIREHVVSGKNMKKSINKIAFVLSAKHFACQKYVAV